MALQEICFCKDTESSEASKIFIRKKKSTACADIHVGGLRERVTPLWWFESLLWSISSGFSFG